MMIGLAGPDAPVRAAPPEIVRTVALHDKGTFELAAAIERRLASRAGAEERRREQCESRFLELLREQLLRRARENLLGGGELERIVERIASRATDPYTAVEDVLGRAGFSES
jgi:putative protein kinase ArgK-like GTPase of G3E family